MVRVLTWADLLNSGQKVGTYLASVLPLAGRGFFIFDNFLMDTNPIGGKIHSLHRRQPIAMRSKGLALPVSFQCGGRLFI